jgi:cytochrome b6-f complex iron-sulfur subunit
MTEKMNEEDVKRLKTRRDFLNRLWVILGVVVSIEFAGVVIAYFRPRKRRETSGQAKAIIEAGRVESFSLNSVTAFVQGKFYLCRMGDGGFLAVSRKCTHLGCTVPWVAQEQRFVCPCHGSVFDISGDVIHSPAPRPLDLYPVFIENQVVKVDMNKQIRRSEFRADQVVYPKKV